MSTLLIKNARYIVSCDDTDRLYERSNLFIRDNAKDIVVVTTDARGSVTLGDLQKNYLHSL